MTRLSDEEARFIAALRRRDERAFNTLVTSFQGRVYSVVLRYLGSPEEARDVAQDVFVTIFEKIHQYRGESKLSTWIYRVATNHAKNRLKYLSRRHHRKQVSFEDMPVKPQSGRFSASVPRPDEAVEGAAMSAFLERAVLLLDDDQRAVVLLRDVQGESYDAIAEITGLNLGTVKSRLHRGRMTLKMAMTAWLEGRDITRTGGES